MLAISPMPVPGDMLHGHAGSENTTAQTNQRSLFIANHHVVRLAQGQEGDVKPSEKEAQEIQNSKNFGAGIFPFA